MIYKNKLIFEAIYILYSFFLIILFLLCKLSNGIFLFTFLSYVPYIIFFMIRELKNKHLIVFLFHAFNLEFFFFMVFRLYFLNVSESGWRVIYDYQKDCTYALQLIFLSIIIMFLTQIMIELLYKNKTEKLEKYNRKETRLSKSELNILCIIFLGYLVIVYNKIGFGVVRVYTTDRHSISYEIGLYAIVLLMFTSFLISILFFDEESRKSKLYVLTLCLYMVEMFAIGFKGYRYILVFIIIQFIFLYFNCKKISMKTIILFGMFGIASYLLMTFAKYWYLGTSFTGINSIGLHERNIFYSFVALLKELGNNKTQGENTYINGLLLLIPRFISGRFSLNSSGNAIIRYFDQGWLGTGMNMGAYYLTEAYLNYKLYGIVVVSIIMAFASMSLEKIRKFKSFSGEFYYAYVLGQMYNVVYYGFTGYFRTLIYYACFLFFINTFHKLYVGVRGENYL